MDQVTIKVIQALGQDHEAISLNQAQVPEGIKLQMQVCQCQEAWGLIDSWNELLITNNLEELIKMQVNALQKSHIIYCGEAAELMAKCGTIPKQIIEIWPAKETMEVRQFRLIHTLQTLKEAYDSWLYQNFLTTVIDSIPELVWIKDTKGAHVLVNQTFADTVHKTKEQIKGKGHYYIWDITPQEYAGGEFVCMESELEVMEKKCTCIFDEPVKTLEGMKQFKTYKSPIMDMENQVMGTVGIAHDVTDFSTMDRELSVLIENVPFPLVFCDRNWKLLRMNKQFRKQFAIPKDEREEFRYREWKKHMPWEVEGLERKMDADTKVQEVSLFVNRRKETFQRTEKTVRDKFNRVAGHFCFYQNISMRKKYENKLLWIAQTDELTNLYNRRYFYHYLEEHESEKMSVLFMDLDHFKRMNDTYGHAFGDQVLKQTADIIKHVFPEEMSARLGGDEFATILLGEQDEQELKHKADRLKEILMESYRMQGKDITISIGIARRDEDGDVDKMVQESDRNMYLDKENK